MVAVEDDARDPSRRRRENRPGPTVARVSCTTAVLVLSLALAGCYQSHRLREGWEGDGPPAPCPVGVWDCAEIMASCGIRRRANGLENRPNAATLSHTAQLTPERSLDPGAAGGQRGIIRNR